MKKQILALILCLGSANLYTMEEAFFPGEAELRKIRKASYNLGKENTIDLDTWKALLKQADSFNEKHETPEEAELWAQRGTEWNPKEASQKASLIVNILENKEVKPLELRMLSHAIGSKHFLKIIDAVPSEWQVKK